jgi:AraC-like DNA-binding protein/ligand-binding sensor protein
MDKPEPVDFVQQLCRSRIYEDYERAFGKTTKLRLKLSSIDKWREVHHVQSKYTNPFCAILSRTRKICGACLEVRPKPTGVDGSDTRTVRCFAGFTHTIVPVKWDKGVIGFLETGQVFLRTPTAARFRKIANQLIRWGIKLNLARLEDAYFRSRVVSPNQYHAIVRLLEIFAEHLSLIANQNALQQCNEDSLIIRRVKDYIARHQFDRIKLEEIARALNVSTFHFCRKFKQATGLTFVKYLTRVRIEKAKILLHNKNLRVSEIAYEVGFQSLTHFNRVFRKLVGHSPTEYRSRLIETI